MLSSHSPITYCRNLFSDGRIWLSASLSVLLWYLPLIAIEAFTSRRTSQSGLLIWEQGPFDITVGFTLMLSIALVMHLLFRERVQGLTGKRFWLFPFISLTVAALIFSSVGVLGALVEELRLGGIDPLWIMTPIYWWIGSLLVVFFHIWLTYPLAIMNQLIIRKVFGTNSG